MGIRMPGMGQYEQLVQKLIEAERMPIEQFKKRKDKVVEEKKEVEKLQTFLTELDGVTNSIKTKTDFYKLKVDSSHPDILEGAITGFAQLGNYEFEVRGMARTEKELAYGFPDKDQTPVGFGYMLIEREDGEPAELTIEPGSTLEGVAQQINESESGVRAMVINTGYTPDSWRLLVISEKSGQEARIHIDEDTTFLEFKEQVTGRNLDVLFEDVPVTSENNVLDKLIEGVNITAKRAEAGTRVQLSIVNDIDKTMEGIKAFVDKYNQIVRFSAEQSKNPSEGNPGALSGDATVKQIMRGLQESLFPAYGGKYQTIAQIGITTNPKTGELTMDDAKVRAALTEDYDGVAQLFIQSKAGDGLGARIAAKIKAYRDPASGAMKSKLRGLDTMIENQDKQIAKKESQLESKEETIRRQFANLEGRVNDLKSQGSFLSARMGGGEAGGGAG
jgi:flagellar hook-associated protein 2